MARIAYREKTRDLEKYIEELNGAFQLRWLERHLITSLTIL